MNNPEVKDPSQAVLNELDFDTYADPIAQSVHNFTVMSDNWTRQMRSIVYTTGTARDRANNALGLRKLNYVRALVKTAETIAKHSGIEDRAVDTLETVLRNDEEHRIKEIAKGRQTNNIQPLTDEYFHHIALALADPEGKTVMPNSPFPVVSEETAALNFANRLDQTELDVMGYRSDYQPPVPLKLAGYAIGQAGVMVRRLNKLRKSL